MSILTTIIQAGKALFGAGIGVFVLYYLVAGMREYREEEMVLNTERMWDQEQAEYDRDEDIHNIVRRVVDDLE